MKRFDKIINEEEEREEEFIEYMDLIDEMLFNPDYEFADITLQGIKSNMVKTGKITKRQIEAVDNIKESVEE